MEQQHKIRVFQWNCRSANSNRGNLVKALSDLEIDFAILSETRYKPNFTVTFKGFNIIRQDKVDGTAGVALLISKKFTYRKIILNPNFNDSVMVCGVYIVDMNLSILSIYKPPKAKVTSAEWQNIFNQVQNPVLVGGDFNAHNQIWGCENTDSDGNSLLNAIDQRDLFILNTGDATRLSYNQSKSAIDITLVSPNLAPSCSWQVIKDTLGSDHFPILINLQTGSTPFTIPLSTSRWNLKKAKWQTYQDLLENRIQNSPTFTSIEERYKYFIEAIEDSAKIAIGKYETIQKQTKSPPPPWWDQECTDIVQERKRAIKTYMHSPTEDNYIMCKKKFAESRRLLKNKGRTHWRTFCNSLNKNTPAKVIWDAAKKFKRINSPINNITNVNCPETYINSLSPLSANQDISEISSQTINPFISKPFTIQELNHILLNIRDTSPGIDNIRYPMLANMPEIAKIFLIQIFNEIWCNGYMVSKFKDILIIPILKPGKDPGLEESYRPISLISCVAKLFERLIKNRLEHWMERNKIFSNNQYGYRAGLGTMDALSKVVTDIQLCFSRNNYLASIFLDLKGAYDCVNLNLLKEKMVRIGIPSNNVDIIIGLYSERKIFLKTKNLSLGPRLVWHGLPQGSVLSPLLFNIYTLDIHDLSTELSIVQYADDFVLYIEGKGYQICINQLSGLFRKVEKWLDKHGFIISLNKTVATIFTRHNTPNINSLQLGTLSLPYQQSVQYLGMIMDKKLTWKYHINKICLKCENIINFLRLCTRTWWGADITTSLLFYRSYMRAIIDYGSMLYGSATNSLLKKLDLVNNKALRICVGAMKSTPVGALYVEANEPPLEYRRKIISAKYILKTMSHGQTIQMTDICKLCTLDFTNKYWEKKNSPPLAEAFAHYSCVEIDIQQNCRQLYFSTDFEALTFQPTIILPTFTENPNTNRNLLNTILDQFPGSLNIYTDGSKNQVGTGCSFIIPSRKVEKMFKLKNSTSTFTAEATAIYEALIFCTTSALNHKKIIILTDSKSCLLCFKTVSQKSAPIICRIRQIIYNLHCNNTEVILIWVKAHTKLQYNEIADIRAKQAINDGFPSESPIPFTDYLPQIKKDVLDTWDQQYKFTYMQRTTQYFLIHPSVHIKSYFFANRRFNSTISRLKFNHGCFPAHLHKIGVLPNKSCDCGYEIGDINHIFFNCSKFVPQRERLFSMLSKIGVFFPVNIVYLLHQNRMEIYKILYEFVKNCDLRI